MPEQEQPRTNPENSQTTPSTPQRRPYNIFSPLLNPKVSGGILLGSLTLSASIAIAEAKFGPELEKIRTSLRQKLGMESEPEPTKTAPNPAPPASSSSTK